jgi:hypothetical protein
LITDTTIFTLCRGSDEQRKKCIEQIETSPENYSPRVFYILADLLYQQGRPNEQAGFWFYFGLLRALYAASRCTDETVMGHPFAMKTEACECLIQEIYKEDARVLETILERVIELDRKIGHNYNPYWINSYGMQGMMACLQGDKFNEKDFSVPVEEWDRIAEETRVNFGKMFEEVIKMIKDQKSTCNEGDWILL